MTARHSAHRRLRTVFRSVAVLGSVVGSMAVIASCSSAPELSLAPQAGSAACQGAPWPASVSSHEAVPTSPDSPALAAWGDPAILARCGLSPLSPTTDDCVTVNGVDWVVRPLTDGGAAVTYGRDPAIEVLAPAVYGPVPLLLPAFGEVAKSLPSNGRRCTTVP